MKFLAFFILFTISCTLLFSQSNKKYVKYLKENSIDLSMEDPHWEKVFDSTFYICNFFWLGEAHAIKKSYQVLWAIFKHIHEKTGFKYYLLESSYLSEILLNKYLETSDEEYLKKYFGNTNGTMGCNIDKYEFYKKMNTYNQSLPKENKIRFMSIDLEFQMDESEKYIRDLMQKYYFKNDTSDIIYQYILTGNFKQGKYRQLYYTLKKDTTKYRNLFKTYFDDIIYMIRNINYLFQARKSDNWNQARDSLMFENYKIRSGNHHFIEDKVFAFFGSSHCYLDQMHNVEWIASRIKKSDDKIKPVTIMMTYTKSESLRPTYLYSDYKPKPGEEPKKYFKIPVNDDIENVYTNASGKSDYTLFNIQKTDEHFNLKSRFWYPNGKENPMHNYFQYILFIQNSPASEPYIE